MVAFLYRLRKSTRLAVGDPVDLARRLNDSTTNPDKQFSTTQATSFTDISSGYGFVSHLPNDSRGSCATVFRSNADGSYTIAVRGTEAGGNGNGIWDGSLARRRAQRAQLDHGSRPSGKAMLAYAILTPAQFWEAHAAP